VSERKRIGLREVRALGPEEIIWDAAVMGFAARRQKSEAVTYLVKYRTASGRQRWYKIGRHGSPWTPETARDEAQRILGEVVKGSDPAAERQNNRKAATISELCDVYLADATAGRLLTRGKTPKKASTLAVDKGRVERHIKPLLGSLAVAAVTRDDIDRFLHDVAEGRTAGKAKTAKKRGLARVTGGRTAASRAVGLLGGIFTYAVRKKLRPDNPVHGVTRFEDGKRDRRLTDDEYAALGAALRKVEASEMWPPAIAAARFLVLTGWRSGEAMALRRPEVDLARRTARLGDTKSGRSIRPLSHVACDVLAKLPHKSDAKVFPASRGGPNTVLHFKKFWPKIAEAAGLAADVTPHVLRHSFASLAADLGYSEPTIAALVGHKGRSVTSRYVHSADAVLLAAADAVANRTAEMMGERQTGALVELQRASG
jgi:integrase